jgi:acyl dehydratase
VFAREVMLTPESVAAFSLTAAHFSTRGAVIGLEFSITFRRAVFADETVRVEWQVVGVKPNARLGGDIVDMRGRLTGADGLARVEATGRVLVTGQL